MQTIGKISEGFPNAAEAPNTTATGFEGAFSKEKSTFKRSKIQEWRKKKAPMMTRETRKIAFLENGRGSKYAIQKRNGI